MYGAFLIWKLQIYLHFNVCCIWQIFDWTNSNTYARVKMTQNHWSQLSSDCILIVIVIIIFITIIITIQMVTYCRSKFHSENVRTLVFHYYLHMAIHNISAVIFSRWSKCPKNFWKYEKNQRTITIYQKNLHHFFHSVSTRI